MRVVTMIKEQHKANWTGKPTRHIWQYRCLQQQLYEKISLVAVDHLYQVESINKCVCQTPKCRCNIVYLRPLQ